MVLHRANSIVVSDFASLQNNRDRYLAPSELLYSQVPISINLPLIAFSICSMRREATLGGDGDG